MVDTILQERIETLEKLVKHKDEVIACMKETIKDLQDLIKGNMLIPERIKKGTECALFVG
jgi:hypothetical protein